MADTSEELTDSEKKAQSKSFDTATETESENENENSERADTETGSEVVAKKPSRSLSATDDGTGTGTETGTEGSRVVSRTVSRSGSRRSVDDSEATGTRSPSPSPRGSRGSRTPSQDGSVRSEGSIIDPYEDLQSTESVQKRRFAELPQARLYTERRQFDDPYSRGLHNHIETLSHHIYKIQAKEIDLLASFSNETFGRDKALELDKENKKREEAIEAIGDIRRERTKYRGMLYDAIQDRNNLLEAREIARREERMIKNRAERIDPWRGVDLYLLAIFAFEVAIVILYIIFMDFTNNPLYAYNVIDIIGPYQRLVYFYNYWVDIAFFIFVGLILMSAWLRKYHYSAIGQTFLIAAFSFQWALLWNGFFKWAAYGSRSKISLETDSVILSLYTVATVVIAYGALVGRASPLQSLIFAFFLTGFQCLNYYITVLVLKAVDNGGSMTIHMFGAFFGVACSFIMGFTDKTRYTKDYADGDRSYKYYWNNNQRASYFGDIWAFVGTLIVFVFFPSFNAAFATTGQAQGRVVVNTVLALTVSGIIAFIFSWISHVNKFSPFEIQNVAITGGVALGSGHSLIINGYEAMFVALVTAIVCWIGIRFITLFFNNPEQVPGVGSRLTSLWGKFPRDTRGVLFSHGLAGWIGGLASIIAIAAYDGEQRFGQPYAEQFHIHLNQAARNTYCWLISWALAVLLGIVIGCLLWLVELVAPAERYPGVRKPKLRKYHDETLWWDLPLDIDY